MASLPRFALAAVLCLEGCRVEPERSFLDSPESAEEGESAPDPGQGGRADSGGTSASGAPSGGSSSGTSGSGGGGAAGEPPPGACDAQAVGLDEIRTGSARPGATLRLDASATSQKFLVSKSSQGSCLWGAFVGAEPRDGEPRGALVVSYGAEALAGEDCAPGTDAIPDMLAAGDEVAVVGRFSTFAPQGCVETARGPQIIADAACPLERSGASKPVEPVALSAEIADRLASGTDAALLQRWAAGLVRLERVNGVPSESGEGIVGAYGVLRLAETRLEIHADIEYGDLSAGGPRDPAKSLSFPYPTTFESVTGLIYLDYCTWALAPRRRCEDFIPKSGGCNDSY